MIIYSVNILKKFPKVLIHMGTFESLYEEFGNDAIL